MFQVRRRSASPKEEQADSHHQHVQVARTQASARRPCGVFTHPLTLHLNGSLENSLTRTVDTNGQFEELCCRPSLFGLSALTGSGGVFQEAVQRSGLLT